MQPIYAIYSSTNGASAEALPVWVVRFQGTCVPLYGGPGGCAPQPLNMVLNAETGEELLTFSD